MSPFNALNELRDATHSLAKEKGWHETQETEIAFISRFIANTHGELSELWEAARNGKLNHICDKPTHVASGIAITCEEEELADILIRVLDYCGRRGLNIGRAVNAKHQYNATRQHRHGGKLA